LAFHSAAKIAEKNQDLKSERSIQMHSQDANEHEPTKINIFGFLMVSALSPMEVARPSLTSFCNPRQVLAMEIP